MSTNKSIENFIIDAKRMHQNKYDYSNVKYITLKDKVNIYCIEHDYTFTQEARNHLFGSTGCKYCSSNVKATLEWIVHKASNTVNKDNKYNYDKATFNHSTKTIVNIKCNYHEEYFDQKYLNHLMGRNLCIKNIQQILSHHVKNC